MPKYKTHAYSEDLSPAFKEKKNASIKKFCNTWHSAWNENNMMFIKWKNFAYQSNIDDAKGTVLNLQNKVPIEINLIENFLSRLVGEFSMAEFGIEVAAADGVIKIDDTGDEQVDERKEPRLKRLPIELSFLMVIRVIVYMKLKRIKLNIAAISIFCQAFVRGRSIPDTRIIVPLTKKWQLNISKILLYADGM